MWNEIVSFFNGVFEKVEMQLRRVRLERERERICLECFFLPVMKI